MQQPRCRCRVRAWNSPDFRWRCFAVLVGSSERERLLSMVNGWWRGECSRPIDNRRRRVPQESLYLSAIFPSRYSISDATIIPNFSDRRKRAVVPWLVDFYWIFIHLWEIRKCKSNMYNIENRVLLFST